MTSTEKCLLEIIDTGECSIEELLIHGPSLIVEATGDDIHAYGVRRDLDRLDSRGLIGKTGSTLQTIVLSRLGSTMLT